MNTTYSLRSGTHTLLSKCLLKNAVAFFCLPPPRLKFGIVYFFFLSLHTLTYLSATVAPTTAKKTQKTIVDVFTQILDTTFCFSNDVLCGSGPVQFFVVVFFPHLAHHNTIHWACALAPGRVRRGQIESSAKRIFWHWELRSGYQSSESHSAGTVADVTTVTGAGAVWAAVKNGRGLKNGVMGCDQWGGSRFKRGEELQRLNPSNSTGRPRSPTPARFITCQVASRGRERLKVVNCGASYTFALAQIIRFWRGRRGGHQFPSKPPNDLFNAQWYIPNVQK